MALDFNSRGYLHQTISLTYEKFKQHFGINPHRIQQLNNALPIYRIFYSCGCRIVYIDGSFISKKKSPEDIDLCFDLTNIDDEKIEKEFPGFFDLGEIGRIHRDLKCHIFHFREGLTYFFDILNQDRDGNPKGLVKLELHDILTYYDQK